MKKFLLALLLGFGSLAEAQSLPILPRSTRANGLGDTSLYMTSDTARRTRAVTTLDLRRVLSVTAFDSLITGKLRLTSSVVGSATWTGLQTFAATQRVDSATGAARSQILTTARTINGTSFDGSGNITVTAAAGTLTGATLASGVTASLLTSFGTGARTDSATGAARSQTLTTARTLWGLSFDGSANVTSFPTFANGARFSGGSAAVGSIFKTAADGLVIQAAVGSTNNFVLYDQDGTTMIMKVLNGQAPNVVFPGAITVASCTGCGGGGSPQDSIRLKNGAAATPSLMFANSLTTGLYRFGADSIGFSALGRAALVVKDSQALATKGRVGQPSYSFIEEPTSGWYRGATKEINLAINGANAVRVANDPGFESFELRPGGSTRFSLGTGQLTMSVPIQGANGTNTSPTYAFTNSTNSGMYVIDNGSSDTLAFATNGGKSLMVTGGTSAKLLGSNGLSLVARGVSQDLTFSVTNSAGTESAVARIRMGGTSNAQFAPNFNGLVNAPFYTFSGDTATGIWYRGNGAGADTLKISTSGAQSFNFLGGATAKLVGGAGDFTLQAGTGNSRRLVLQTTSSGGTVTTALRMNEIQQVIGTNGTSSNPGFSFASDTTMGIRRSSPGVMGISMTGQDALSVSLTSLDNPGGSMNLTMGAGSPTTPTYSFNGDANVGMYRFSSDTIGFASNGVARLLIANQGATGTGDVALCVTTTGVTKVITQGATCGSSTQKVKTNILPLSQSKTMMLRPVSYSYIPQMYNGRSEFGLIAEEAAKVDPRLAFYADHDEKLPNGQTIKKGDPINVNDRAVLAMLIATVQSQQKQIDSLMKLVRKP